MFKRLFGGRGDEAAAPQSAMGLPGPAQGSSPLLGAAAPAGVHAGAGDGAQRNAIGLGAGLSGSAPDAAQVGGGPEPGGAAPAGDDASPSAPSTETGDEGAPPTGAPDKSAVVEAPEPAVAGAEPIDAAPEEPEPAGDVEAEDPPVDTAGVHVAAEPAVLAPGATIGGRYTLVRQLTADEAGQLLGVNVGQVDAAFFAVEDERGYERCWSCGSTNNGAEQRFCVDCGAPLLHHTEVLARTDQPVGDAEEIEEGGAWYRLVHPLKQFSSLGMALEVGGYSAEGPHHPNEDSYWSALAGGCYDSMSESFGVFALADGMGGYAPGSGLVSRDIVRTVGRGIFGILDDELEREITEEDLQAIVRGAIAQANDLVLDAISRAGEMGATLVVAVIYGPNVYIANVGDSRAYYISPAGNVTQITHDQSLIEQQIMAGLLSPDAAYTAIGNNVILHAIGEESVEDAADWYRHPLEPGSRLLLCSDGYWKTMGTNVWLADEVGRQSTMRGQAQALVEQALARDTDDNTTVLLIGVD